MKSKLKGILPCLIIPFAAFQLGFITPSTTKAASLNKTIDKLVFYEDKKANELDIYLDSLKENIELTNERYSKKYRPYDFVVESTKGTVLIQDLIDPKSVEHIIENLDIKGENDSQKIITIYDYIQKEYDFIPDPNSWPTVKETINSKKGDCNSLSLVLMSLLSAADIDKKNICGGFSYGHMWVSVYYNNKWNILETDKEDSRRKIYATPGFYDNPIYKIFPDETLRRIKKH